MPGGINAGSNQSDTTMTHSTEAIPAHTTAARRAANPPDLSNFSILPDEARVNIDVVRSLYGIGTSTVWLWVRQGRLPAPVRLGRCTRWTVGELRAALRCAAMPSRRPIMSRPDVIAPPRPAGQGGAEGANQGMISEAESGTHGRGNVIPFCVRRRTCGACGQHLALDDLGAACARCLAWDMLLRAMSLRRQALGDLARAGGAR